MIWQSSCRRSPAIPVHPVDCLEQQVKYNPDAPANYVILAWDECLGASEEHRLTTVASLLKGVFLP